MKSIRELLSGAAPVTLPATATVREAVEKMAQEKIGAMLVANDDGRPQGIFTERDLMTRVVLPKQDPDEVTLGDVMTADVFTLSPDKRVNEVSREMADRHIRHLPVVEDGVCIGMLGLRDLLREHLSIKRAEVKALTAYIQGEGETPAP